MKQENAFEILKTGRNVFLTGSAGTGKTYLLNRYIQYLKVLIIDEISMVSPDLFSSLDKILRAFKFSTKPFGGVQLILSGDFFQLPPISKGKKDFKFAWQITSWDEADLKICYLREKFRHSSGVLIDILDEIRSNSVSENSMEIFRSCYKKEILNNFKATKLYTHNIDVDRINYDNLNELSGELRVYEARDRGSKRNIERIFKGSLVKKELKLKKDAVVMFIKNNYEQGYINGTLGKVIGFSKMTGNPIVEIFSGRKIITEYEDWNLEDNRGDVVATVKQIPLRLAWALTIHKSQGMTLDAAEIDLSKTFEVGQGYVALSRIKSIEGLRLMGLNDIALQVDKQVLNVDKEMMKLSKLNILKFKSFSKNEKEEMYINSIMQHGGCIETKKIEKYNKKEKTLEITKHLLIKKETILEITKKRNLSKNTIINHILKISKIYPKLDLMYLMPSEKILKKVLKSINAIKIKNDSDDFSEDGEIRLKPIYECLKKKIGYDDIRLALIFLPN